jgi:hypothetical protein
MDTNEREFVSVASGEEESNRRVFQLVYVSGARERLDDGDLKAILEVSRRNNARLGVTGMLLCHEGCFIQALEGDRDVVESLYARIAQDQRHGRIVVLYRGEADSRTFPDWTMGFRRASPEEMGQIDGLNDFLRSPETTGITQLSESRVRELLVGFREGRWRR